MALAGCEQQESKTNTSAPGSPVTEKETEPSAQESKTNSSAPGSPVTEKETEASAAEPIVIGVAAPFTGSGSAFGEQIKMAVVLAQQEVNAAGGVNGRLIELNMQDDAGKADDAQKVAMKLANDDRVIAVVGHFNSSCSLAGKELYSHAKMVMFSPASTNVNVTKDNEYVYRNIFTDEFQGQCLAEYVAKVLNLKKVAILFDNDDYGTGLKDSFRRRAGELNLAIVSEQAFVKDNTDFRAQLTSINLAGPEIILVAGLYNEAANIAKQAREVGIKTPFIGGDGVFSDKFVELAGEAGDNMYVSCPFLFDLAGESGRKFAEGFKKKYDREPDAWAALSYDAFNLIVDALKKKGVKRESVLEYLKEINSPETAYDGLAGKTYFDEEGDCKKPVQIAVAKGGKFVAAEKQLPVAEDGAGSTGRAAPAPPGSVSASTPEPSAGTAETSAPPANQ